MSPLERLRAAGVRRLCVDSRMVAADVAFVALPPAQASSADGRQFAASALAAGAAMVIAEAPCPEGLEADRWMVLPDLRRSYPALAAALAGPGPDTVIGITGTDGKTSVAWLTSELLNHLDPGSTARLGTLGAQWAGVDENPGFTTPPAAQLHPLLGRMRADGQRRLVMEISSHAIALGRIAALPVRVGVLSTLARDHLDFHGTIEAYHGTKLDWLDGVERIVTRQALVPQLRSPERVRAVGGEGFRIEAGPRRGGWTPLQLIAGPQTFASKSTLLGALMLENLSLACAVAMELGFPLEAIAEALPGLRAVPGRFEPVGDNCVVDYAHTPDALRQGLAALRSGHGGRIVAVFGAGGERDRGKRPEMAQAVEEGADMVILTHDNPRREDPNRILEDVAAGFAHPASSLEELARDGRGWLRIDDRRQALAAALSLCGPDDVLFAAGKGAEPHQQFGLERRPFDDRAVLRELMGDAS